MVGDEENSTVGRGIIVVWAYDRFILFVLYGYVNDRISDRIRPIGQSIARASSEGEG